MLLLRRPLLPILLAALLALPAVAAASDAKRQLEQVRDTMFDALEGRAAWYREEPERFHRLIEENLEPHIDFPRFAQMVAPTQWRTASDEQRRAFVAEFRLFLIRLYAGALLRADVLDSLTRDAFTIDEPRAGRDERRVSVRATMDAPGLAPVMIVFHFYQSGEQWLIWNLEVESLNMVMTYRQQFQGATMQRVIDWLRERNQRLAEDPAAADEVLPQR